MVSKAKEKKNLFLSLHLLKCKESLRAVGELKSETPVWHLSAILHGGFLAAFSRDTDSETRWGTQRSSKERQDLWHETLKKKIEQQKHKDSTLTNREFKGHK